MTRRSGRLLSVGLAMALLSIVILPESATALVWVTTSEEDWAMRSLTLVSEGECI